MRRVELKHSEGHPAEAEGYGDGNEGRRLKNAHGKDWVGDPRLNIAECYEGQEPNGQEDTTGRRFPAEGWAATETLLVYDN